MIRILATALVGVAGTAVIGHAAGLTTSSDTLGANYVTIPRCTSAALTVVETVTTTYVTGVTVSNVPSTCGGGTMQLTMAESSAYYSPASQTVPTGGGSLTFAIPSGNIPVTAVAQADVVITGP